MELESFSYEWETYGTELRSRYGIEDIYSTNHSVQNHCSTNHSTVTVWHELYHNYLSLIRKRRAIHILELYHVQRMYMYNIQRHLILNRLLNRSAQNLQQVSR